MGENTAGNTSKNPVLPRFSSPEKDYFALDVDISPFLSAICRLIGLFRSNRAMGAHPVMS